MDIRTEQDFVIDGVKSRIHCLVTDATRIKNTSKISYHNHDYIELLYALTPGATVWINGDAYPFEEGDLVLINSQEPHTVTSPTVSSHICVKFSPGILYSDEQALLEFKYVTPFISEKRHQKRFCKGELEMLDVHGLMHDIMWEWEEKSVAYELMIRAKLLVLFSGILRYWHDGKEMLSNLSITDTVKRALDYTDEHYATATERDVADFCAVSYNHFSRTFKRTMGKSFSDYLTQIRLREAEKLLLLSDKSMTEIALEVGFSSSSHFISRFRESRDMTPGQFRARVRGKGEMFK